MEKGHRELLLVIVFVVSLVVVGTFGYHIIENWSLLDSLYMTIITITTVGYGEIHPLSHAGRVFTIILLTLGVGTVAMSATLLTRFIIEKELNIFLGRNKMNKKLKAINKHYVVCGFGRTGKSICNNLGKSDIPFVVIENDQEKYSLALDYDFIAIQGDATLDTILTTAGIERACGIVTSLSTDADNLFVTLAARELNPEIHIIVRGSDPSVEERLLRAGADTVVYPLQLGGEQIARLIAMQQGVTGQTTILKEDMGIMGYNLKLYKHFEQEPITIREMLKRTKALSAVGLKPENGDIVDQPGPEIQVSFGDSVTILMSKSDAAKEKISGEKKHITWSSELSVGIQEFDEEHKHIIDLINKLDGAMGQDSSVLATVFNRLTEYTATHFKHEEDYFAKHDYPAKAAHIAEHKRLTQKVMDLNKNKDYVFPENVSDFLRSWIKDHILGTDKKYAKFYEEQEEKNNV